MDDTTLTTALDTDIGVPLKPVHRAELLSGMAERRRTWTLEQKLALFRRWSVCGNIAAFARERDVSTALLYTWRRELRYAVEASKLAPRNGRYITAGFARWRRGGSRLGAQLFGSDRRVALIWWPPSFRLCRPLVDDRARSRCTYNGCNAPGGFPQRSGRLGCAGRR